MSPLARISSLFVRFRRSLIVLGGLYALYALYALLGFLVLPGVLQKKLTAALADATHREARIAQVRVNPLVLSVTVDGLEIRTKAGGPWVGCERLYANVQLLPLLARTLELKELAIIRPAVQIRLDAQGRPEFADLLEAQPEAPKAAEPPSTWTVAVDHFWLVEGRLPFVDTSTTPDFTTTLGPLSLQLEGLRTDPGQRGEYGFSAVTEAGERLSWEGNLGVNPLASTGRLRLDRLDLAKYGPYLHESLAMDLRGGRASLSAGYRLAWGPAEKAVKVEGARLDVDGLSLAEPGAPEIVSLPHLEATGVEADLLANRVTVARLAAVDGRLDVVQSRRGLNLGRLFAPPPGVKPKPKDPQAKPLDLTLRELALERFRLGWTDETCARPVKLEARELGLLLKDLTLDPAKPCQAELKALLGTEGKLQLAGPLKPLAFAADLQAQIEALDLVPFEPYLHPATDLKLHTGKFGLKGRLGLAFEGRKQDGLRFSGDAWVERFEAADQRDDEVALRWQKLSLQGLETGTNPVAVKMKTLDWAAPEARLVIAPDGTTNVARALKLAQAPAHPLPGAVIPATPPSAGPPLVLDIALVALCQGRLSFVDRTLTPNAALLLSDLEGRYERLSTDPAAVSRLRLTGKAGGLAPVLIEGRAMPFRTDQDTDVVVKIQGSDLTDFDPYARKYLGYTVQKGKLGLDASVKLQKRALNALVTTKLDQFYLGDKVQSPDATGLPVKLALAILRDRKGVIELEVPVDGNLDDPDIHYGKMVWKAVLNLLGKVATSPFTLLGKLFGGGEDISFAAFAPGSDALDAAAQKKLQGLAKSLAERPELRLDVEGAADPAADGAALKRAAFETKLRAESARLRGGEVGEGGLTPAQREAALKSLHAVAFPVDPKSKAPEAPLAEMEQRLLGQLPDDSEALASLADRRAKAVIRALLAMQAPQDRIFETQGTRKGDEARQARVWFGVK